MKNITSIFCIALTAILTPTTSYGNFSGSDDFNDNSKDLALKCHIIVDWNRCQIIVD